MTKQITLLALLTALFFLSRPIWAQSGRYVIEQRYVQQIAWIGDEYTLKYEVVIERNEGGGYGAYLREFTELPAIQISLPVGNYRYRIIPYDYLDQSGEPSNWVNIDIKPAPIVSVEVKTNEDGSYVLHSNDNKQLIPDVNEIVIKNPDELEKQDGTLIVDKNTAAAADFYLSAAWVPLSPIYGRIQEIFGSDFYFTGAALRFGMLFNKIKWFTPGLELSTSWYALNKVQDNDKIGIQAGVTGFNLVARKRFAKQRMAFTLRAGGGLAFQIGEITIGDYSYSMGGLLPQLNADASILWFALKQLYLEAGVGFNHFINQNNSSGCLRPWIGIGWQF
jgi:hypothetical protein